MARDWPLMFMSRLLFENNMNKIGTVGSLVDITELSDMKRDLKHLSDVTLRDFRFIGNAFVVFDGSFNLSFITKLLLFFGA